MRRNHAIWLGPIVTFAGAVSYFLYFARFPSLRDVPWVNLPIVAGDVRLSDLRGRKVVLVFYRGFW